MKSHIRRRKAGKKILVSVKIQWVAFFDEPSKNWIGVCDPLGLTASGLTRSDLVQSIREATDIMFEDLFQ